MNDPTPKKPGLLARLSAVRIATLVQAACVVNLLALALMVWSLLDPTPLPVMLAMSIGQAVGTLALLLYLAAVVLSQLQLRRAAEPRVQSADE